MATGCSSSEQEATTDAFAYGAVYLNTIRSLPWSGVNWNCPFASVCGNCDVYECGMNAVVALISTVEHAGASCLAFCQGVQFPHTA